MATAKSKGKKSLPLNPEFFVKSITITHVEQDLLDQLSQRASDFLGWTVSNSAILRALVRYVVDQGPPAEDALFLEVEKELRSGVVWGRKKQ
jgi:hypothetical protein